MPCGSFVALGDSFTEGVGDPYPDGDSPRGWADRFAGHLASASPDLQYANLAIRGKLLGQVIDEQVPEAVRLAPDLVSIAAGGNDLLRPRADPDALAALFDRAVASLRSAGSTIMLFTGFDPGGFPMIRMIRGKVAAYNAHLRLIAGRYDCLHVDLWSMRVLADPREWCTDRLHLAQDGHHRVALRACEVAGVPVTEDWRAPLPPLPASGWPHLADTSALARLRYPSVAAVLGPLIASGLVATCGVIEFEMSWATRTPEEFGEVRADREAGYEWLAIHDEDWHRALHVQAALWHGGRVRAVSFSDLLVAAVAERERVTILHYDGDFELIAQVTRQPVQWVVPRGSVP